MKKVTYHVSMGFLVMSASCGHPSEKPRPDSIATPSSKNENANQDHDPSDLDANNLSVPGSSRVVDAGAQVLSPALPKNSTVAPTTTPSTTAWAQIPDPTQSSPVIGGLRAIAAGNAGKRSSTWSFKKVPAGKYDVEMFYHTEAANATCVAVQFKTTGQAGFAAPNVRLDQKTGAVKVGTTSYTNLTTAVGTALGNFAPVLTTVTPSGINIPNGTTANSGTLDVRISDSGCASGRMIADWVRIRSKQ